jgi:hypothetical protein
VKLCICITQAIEYACNAFVSISARSQNLCFLIFNGMTFENVLRRVLEDSVRQDVIFEDFISM